MPCLDGARLDANRRLRGADDGVAEAAGEARGDALRWKDVMALPVEGGVYDEACDDWMFLMGGRVMRNR